MMKKLIALAVAALMLWWPWAACPRRTWWRSPPPTPDPDAAPTEVPRSRSR